MKKINTKGFEVAVFSKNEMDYVSLTDIARYKNYDNPKDVVKNWLRNRNTIEFLGIWEKINNKNFKGVEFDSFRQEAGFNYFVLSPQKWIEKTAAVGIVSKSGRYNGGTFAHKDIAFEFAAWVSPEFKLYLIKEFQRLKNEESNKLFLGWDAKRLLTKINYKIQTDAILDNIILPRELSKSEAIIAYASEADILNKALFNLTAREWKNKNPHKKGNVRDYANVIQLVVLANLENINAEYIRNGLPQKERLLRLNRSAIFQIKSLLRDSNVKKFMF